MRSYGVFAPVLIAAAAVGFAGTADAPQAAVTAKGRPLVVPAGYTVERVAGPPLVSRPINAGFDDEGRLYVTESAGENLGGSQLLQRVPNRILRLTDTDGDGRFDQVVTFADRMTFPTGALWHGGALYSTSYPNVWKLTDDDGDGVADRRTAIVGQFNSSGNGADLHGPFLGPDGRLYFCDGNAGHDLRQGDGVALSGRAAGMYRCRPDGSGLERVCGGGMVNAVEAAFTSTGEPLFCANIVHGRPRRDGILFGIEGGVFPHSQAAIREFRGTGQLLPLTGDLGWVAVSSLVRTKGAMFGGAWFTAQFNPHRIQRHTITRAGAGFAVTAEDFLTCDDMDFHPTGVIEDADGSLLVIDTGGWFVSGCPTSRTSKPNVLGGIYRIRKAGFVPPADPRGVKMAWNDVAPTALAERLADPRWAVRERAVTALAAHGDAAVPALAARIRQTDQPLDARLGALWALCRIGTADALTALRPALADPMPDMAIAAAHAAGLHRDAAALPGLLALASGARTAAERREAATAIGRLGDRAAVPALLAALRETNADVFLDHAVTYALIQLADPHGTRAGLTDAGPAARRAALVALEKMPRGDLHRADVLPLLSDRDPAVRRAAVAVVTGQRDWVVVAMHQLREWLAGPALDADTIATLRGLLETFANDGEVRTLMATTARDPQAPAELRRVMLEVMADVAPERAPAEWRAAARACLGGDDDLVRRAVAVLAAAPGTDLDLLDVADDPKRPADLRSAALAVVAPRLPALGADRFAFLLGQLGSDRPLLERRQAAAALGRSKLDADQLRRLTDAIGTAGPVELLPLLAAFEAADGEALGAALVRALEKSPGLAGLPADAIVRATARFPESVRTKAAALASSLAPDVPQQQARITELAANLPAGDVGRGRAVFFSTKAACSSCHAAERQGGNVGPDLGKIGGSRSARDLLEAIVYPSATIGRGYESVTVVTNGGATHTGLVVRETAAALVVRKADQSEVTITRSTVQDLQPSAVSIMPEGLGTLLSRQELADVIAYLGSLK